ncbi:MAG: hypothetical protein R3Y24_08575 [Eubacteriales bacterium]
MVNEIQGQLFFDALESVQGEYILARTYNILVNNQLCYSADNAIIELEIPETLQEEDRTYSMFSVTEGGLANSLPDLDQELTTITFATNNQYYAFALGYMDDTTLSGTISEVGALVVGNEDDSTPSGATVETGVVVGAISTYSD